MVLLIMQGCMADMRTPLLKEKGITESNSKKGRQILEEAWRRHGFDKLENHRVYSIKAHDVWKGLMGKPGRPWPDAESQMAFKYAIGTFDGQVEFLDGRRKGEFAGMAEGSYYEIDPAGNLKFMKMKKKRQFGLGAYQYFFEMPDRLKKVPIISFAGEKEFRGQKYDIVFATWQTPEPHMEHDQYTLYINQKTKMIDFAVYSLRHNYLKIPGYKAFYGAIEYEDYRPVDGILIPHQQTVYLNGLKENKEKHIHQLRVLDFKFDSFNILSLYPAKNSTNQ